MDEVRSSVKEIQDLAIAITEVVEKKGEKYEVQNREIYRNIKIKILKLYKGLLQFRTSFVEDK